MRTFTCAQCGQLLFFDNDRCMRCGSDLAFRPSSGEVERFGPTDRRCANHALIGCSWLVEDGQDRCRSCRLTRTRPPETSREDWAKAEGAKRQLIFQSMELHLDLSRVVFDLKSSDHEQVVTGHADGVITIDVNESDDVTRTRAQERMGEAYRTMLGHFRHEIGHYLWTTLVDQQGRHDDFRTTFGDERADYGQSLQTHYGSDPAPGWENAFVSAYATAHPWEDFAETLAHYLHIRAVLQTAASFGISVDGTHPVLDADPEAVEDTSASIAAIVDQWLPLTYALNAVNRSMGIAPLYPFILAPAVVAKLDWVHGLVEAEQPTAG